MEKMENKSNVVIIAEDAVQENLNTEKTVEDVSPEPECIAIVADTDAAVAEPLQDDEEESKSSESEEDNSEDDEPISTITHEHKQDCCNACMYCCLNISDCVIM